jgi:hypothetical protein
LIHNKIIIKIYKKLVILPRYDEHLLHPRIIESKDWATILFVLAFAIVAITKSVYENRFGDFMNLIFSDKYAKVYRDGSHLKGASPFLVFLYNFLCLFIQLS